MGLGESVQDWLDDYESWPCVVTIWEAHPLGPADNDSLYKGEVFGYYEGERLVGISLEGRGGGDTLLEFFFDDPEFLDAIPDGKRLKLLYESDTIEFEVRK